MWFGLILVCSIEQPDVCTTLVGNMVRTEDACEATYDDGVSYVERNLPNGKIVSFRCDTWGEPA